MKKALERMPTTIDDAFRKILERIETSQDPDSATTAIRTLTWVYYARRPLQMKELREALVVEDGDHDQREDAISADSIIDCCLSFITHDHNGEVRFIHPSVQRWLDEEPQHGKLLPEIYLANTCLTYLNFDAFDKQIECLDNNDDNDDNNDNNDNDDNDDNDDLIDSDDGEDQEEPALERHLICYPFHGYSSQFWHYHTRNVEDDPKIQEIAFDFLQSEAKRSLMLQIDEVLFVGFHLFRLAEDATVLHFAARFGLLTLCDILLNVRGRYPALLYSMINGQYRTASLHTRLAAGCGGPCGLEGGLDRRDTVAVGSNELA